MNFLNFLHYNNVCPICNNELTLYMKWLDNYSRHSSIMKLFKTEYKQDGIFCLEEQSNFIEDEKISLILHDQITDYKFQFSFHSEEIAKAQNEVHFFWLCQPSSLRWLSYNYYEIDMDRVCYFRNFCGSYFSGEKENIRLCEKIPRNYFSTEISEFINPNEREIFVIKGKEKVYSISLDHNSQKILFYYYSIDDKRDLVENSYTPVYNKLTLPYLKLDYSISNREKLISKFDGWILMS